MKTRGKVILGVVIIVLMLLSCVGWWILKEAIERPQEAYAVQHAAELLIEYMKTHTNRWPTSWRELRTARIGDQDHFGRFGEETGGYPAFLDEVERRVEIDFTVTSAQLLAATQSTSVPPFRVVRLRNGRNTHWVSLEPNALVAEYLRSVR